MILSTSYISPEVFTKVRIQYHIDWDANDRINNHKIS